MTTVIPKPLSFIQKTGDFVINSNVSVGGEFPWAQSKFIAIALSAGIKLEQKSKGEISFVCDKNFDNEEYSLCVDSNGIKITASTEAGAFYAVQTIRQLADFDIIKNASETKVIACDIKDKPRFVHRSFMLDEGRHFFGKAVVKEILDIMAILKMNIFHWHLTEDQGWRIESKIYPLLTSKGSIRNSTQLNMIGYHVGKEKRENLPYGEGLFYTQEDVKEIVEYAKQLNIDIVPEIDMPGHFVSAISCYPHISCEGKNIDVSNRWGVMDTIGCVGGEEFMPFIKNILDEIIALFPSEYIHIGGDEVPKSKWKVCPKCQAKIKELGLKNENELQGWFNNQVADYVKSHGKKIIGWNEILEASVLSDETVVQWWVGGAKSRGVLDWLNRGNKVIISPAPYLYMDHLYSMKDLKKSYSIDMAKMKLPANLEKYVLGIEAPMWTEYVRNKGKLDFNMYPRIISLAEVNWTSKENRCFADFENRLANFNAILDVKNIEYAPRKYYLCRGFSGILRRMKAKSQWASDGDTEYKDWKNNK